MAFSVKRSGSRKRGTALVSEINVTPFVDVVLVLLIIFMVTAPLLTVGVPVSLPKVNSKSLSENIEPLIVSIQSDGNLYLQETAIEIESLVAKLIAITQEKPDTKIYIRADQAIEYGKVMAVMGAINLSGLSNIALLTEMPKQPLPGHGK